MTVLVDTPIRTRPFADPCFIGGRERELLLDVLESCRWSGFRAGTHGRDAREICSMTSAEARKLAPAEIRFLGGPYVRTLEAEMAARTGSAYGVACNSATSGLVMALGAIGLRPGDEVLVPCMSFHATATAVVALQGVPVFAEVDPRTFCIDPIDSEEKITERTRAILVVHLGGVPADMDAIEELARRRGLSVIEDCAQAPGARHRGREVGSIGAAGVFSLTENKSITCGEGGIVVTDDPRIAMKCRLIRNHGEGTAEESWNDEELENVVGMNFRLTELQAAIGVAQLEQLEERNRVRNDNARYLIERLRPMPDLVPQRLEEDCDPAWFMLKFRYRPSPGMPSRDELVRLLEAEGIPAVAGYPRLLHESPLFTRRPSPRVICPRSEAINREFVWLPFIHPPNTREDMEDAVKAIEKVLG